VISDSPETLLDGLFDRPGENVALRLGAVLVERHGHRRPSM
jgi:hypothetical protein